MLIPQVGPGFSAFMHRPDAPVPSGGDSPTDRLTPGLSRADGPKDHRWAGLNLTLGGLPALPPLLGPLQNQCVLMDMLNARGFSLRV